MSEHMTQIFNFDNIIQGALGSGLFALILYILTVAIRYSIKHTILFSKKTKRELLSNERLRYQGITSDDMNFTNLTTTALIYISLNFFFKAVTALVLGYFLSYFNEMFKHISCLFSLYYLFLAVDSVRDLHSQDKDELLKRLKEVKAKIAELDKAS